MRKIFGYLLLSLLTYSAAWGQSPWVGTPNGPFQNNFAGSQILRFEVPTANVVWTLYYEYLGLGLTQTKVTYTADGGQNWQILTTGSTSGAGGPNPYSGFVELDLSAINSQMAWMIKYYISSGSNRSNPILVRTTSGPAGFTDIPNVLPADVEKLHFFTATTGIAIAPPAAGSSAWRIYRTSDAGANWIAVANTSSLTRMGNETLAIKHSVGSSFWLTTSNNTVLRTADAGLTWSATTGVGRVLAFEADALHGLAYGSQLLRTADGGLTWTPVTFSGQALFRAISAIPTLAGTYISGGYELNSAANTYTVNTSVSYDYGASWRLLGTGSTLLSRIVAASPTQIWAGTDYNQHAPRNSYDSFFQPLVAQYAGGSVLATQKATSPASPFVAYPNPTYGLLKLDGPLQASATARVYDSAGHLCREEKVSDTNRQIDLSMLPAGLYHLVVADALGVMRSQRVNKIQ